MASQTNSRNLVLPSATPRVYRRRPWCGGHPPGGAPRRSVLTTAEAPELPAGTGARSAGAQLQGLRGGDVSFVIDAEEAILALPKQHARGTGPAVPVTLHLYDVTGSEAVSQLNGLFKAVGTGAFHAGIEVHSREWSYGFSDGGGSGVFDCEPRRCSMHTYRESIVVGWCRLSEEAVLALIAELSEQWLGGDYDLIRQNCCHFSDCLARRLGAGRLPERVTSLAAVGAAVDDGMRAAAARAAAAGAVAGELDQRYQVSATAGELAAGALDTASTLDEQYKVTATAGALATEAADKAGVLMFEVDKRYNVAATARELASGAVSRAGKLEEEYRVVSATGTLLDQLSEAVVTAAEQAPQWMGQALQLSTSQAPLSYSQSSRTDHSAAAVQRPRC